MPMLVDDIMRKSTKSVMPETSLAEAMSIMQENQLCSLPVSEINKRVGSISLDDINKAILGLTSTKVAA